LGALRARVLDHVRKGLGDDEVRAGLDLRRKPLLRKVHVDRQVEPPNQGVDAGPQAAVAEDRGQDPVGELAQLPVALLGVRERLADQQRRVGLAPLLPAGASGGAPPPSTAALASPALSARSASLSVTIACTSRCWAPS